MAGLLVGFFLLVKFSLGLSSAVTLGVGCCLVRRPVVAAQRLAVSAIALAAAFVSGWLGSGNAISGIAPYLTLGFEMAREYSSAMTVHGDRWGIAVGAFLVWFTLVALWRMPAGLGVLMVSPAPAPAGRSGRSGGRVLFGPAWVATEGNAHWIPGRSRNNSPGPGRWLATARHARTAWRGRGFPIVQSRGMGLRLHVRCALDP